MRTVRIPAAIELQPESETTPAVTLTFEAFLLGPVFDGLKLTDLATVQGAQGLADKLPEKPAGEAVELTDAEHELLSKTMASMALKPGVKFKLLPFFAAVHGLPGPRV